MKKQLTAAALVLSVMPLVARAQSNRERVIAAELNFATQAAQLGTKAAFLANCSPTSLITENGRLVNAQDAWAARPARPNSRLTWYPVLADAAQSGDLGYTTGPWTAFLNDKPQVSGEYVTVWRKQLDGSWKVAVDMGIERIGTAPAKPATVPQPRLQPAVATPSTAPSNILLDLDARFAAAQLLKPGATYQQFLSAEARLYRPGLSMMQGEAASANMKNLDRRYFFAATGGYLAAAGDLGYVVGSMRRDANAKNPEETGSYLHIWRREAVAGWRLVAEVINLTAPAGAAPGAANAVSQQPAKPGQ